jgi:H-type lectin domain
VLATLLQAGASFAAEVNLAWDPSPSAGVGGYIVRFGGTSGSYASSVDVGLMTTHTVTGLAPGSRYFFVVVAYDAARTKQSSPSNEVSAVVPGGSTTGLQFQFADASVGHDWVRVELDPAKNFADPIVIAKPVGSGGVDPALVRIDNVGPTGFDLSVQEWDYNDGGHIAEKIGYLAVERGSQVLPSGARVEADRFTGRSSSSFAPITFKTPFLSTPVVVLSITSRNGSAAVTTRLRRVTRTGFEYQLQEQQSNPTNSHPSETISYVAWEVSTGTIGGVKYQVNRTGSTITQEFSSISFASPFRFPPSFLADMQTANDLDPAALRYRKKNATSVQIRVEEETSLSPNTSHGAESVGYILLGWP